MLFFDKIHFLVQRQHRRYVLRNEREKVTEWHINQTVKHPQKKMFCSGLGSLYPCSGTINANKYIDVVNHKVMRDMQIAFPDGGSIFQHDSALCHSAKKVKKVLQKNGIKVLKWSGNSPDLNPIENLWGIIKNKLRSKDCKTVNKLIEAIISVWYHDDKIAKGCQKLISSMPKRVKKVLKNKEGYI